MSKEKYITGLIIEPNQYPRQLKIEAKLEAYQKAVGGYIECIDLPNGATIICNEEGKICGEKLNRILYDDTGKAVDVVAGTMVVVGFNPADGSFVSMSAEQSDEVIELFRFPDMFFKIDDTVHMINTNWQPFFEENALILTDRNTDEEKYRIPCKSESEQYRIYDFIVSNKSQIIRNISRDITPIEISVSKEPISFDYDFYDEER